MRATVTFDYSVYTTFVFLKQLVALIEGRLGSVRGERRRWKVCSSLLQPNRLLGGLLRQQNAVDVRKDAALRDRDAREQLVELLVVADGELQMARVDARLFVVTSRVAGEFEHLGGEILEDGGYVDGRASANALSVVT